MSEAENPIPNTTAVVLDVLKKQGWRVVKLWTLDSYDTGLGYDVFTIEDEL